MKDFIRYNSIIRRFLIKLSHLLSNKQEEKLLDFLYPDDCIVKFLKESEVNNDNRK